MSVYVVYALCLALIVQSVIHHFERRDLYNRIMSKTLTEYKGENISCAVSAHRRVLNRWKEKI